MKGVILRDLMRHRFQVIWVTISDTRWMRPKVPICCLEKLAEEGKEVRKREIVK